MTDPEDVKVTPQTGDGPSVNPGRLQEFLSKSTSEFFHIIINRHFELVKENLARERIPIAVKPAGSDSNDLVSHGNLRAVNKLFVIDNFIGERHPRTSKIVGSTRIKISGDKVTVTGPDKEETGQTAANIEQATVIKGYDIRVFQDGIYITKKA